MILKLKQGYFKLYNQYLLQNINLIINKNEKICLLGNNGVGKSTLLKIIYEKIKFDKGIIEKKKSIKIKYLKQKLPKRNCETISQNIYKHIEKRSNFLLQYDNLIRTHNAIEKDLYNEKLFFLRSKIKKNNLWKKYILVNKFIKELSLNKDSPLSFLSGGNLQKISIIKVLSSWSSNLFLLDEPTNHLDTKSIIWLESYIKKFSGSILFVSHDRSFINNVATNIIELNNQTLTNWKEKKYENFIKKKKVSIKTEKIQNKKFIISFKKEEKKGKKGIKARNKRNIKQLKKIQNMQKIINKINNKKIYENKYPKIVNILHSSHKTMISIKNINLSYNNSALIKNFSSKILYGEKIALIGSNGCGKSSLLKIILKKLNPQTGNIKYNSRVKIEDLDQEYAQLNKDDTVLENLLYGRDSIQIEKKTYTIIGLLKKFFFSEDQIYAPAKSLSGGEVSRLLLLKLFFKPSNVLILDEPTNHLDFKMLSFLEKFLINYTGTVIFSSHDRYFIDKISNKLWFFNNNKIININHGNINTIYDEFTQKKNIITKDNKKNKFKKSTINLTIQKEIKKIPKKIENIERKIDAIYTEINNINFYKNKTEYIKKTYKKLNQEKTKLKNTFKHWENLENLKKFS